MIKPIIKDIQFLNQPSIDVTINDLSLIKDLQDTLNDHKDHCIGLAANMIGVLKNAIIVEDTKGPLILLNPVILKQTNSYQTEESCLSLQGQRTTKRYQTIKVSYLNEQFQQRIKTFTGLTAQIIQHEIDHCHGIII